MESSSSISLRRFTGYKSIFACVSVLEKLLNAVPIRIMIVIIVIL